MTPQPSIGHYRLGAKLGEGGMGAVYRATDTRLHREVAVKILPDAFAADPDRLARFTREAQVLASLNHPHIAAIYGIEDRALVMELVEGPTLEERIAQGPILAGEAVILAAQIADALDAAHEKGIVHRDLKPANIKLTSEGKVKLLDFGLAKAMADEPAPANPTNSPTLTMRATLAGVILGTAAYMSPEQAEGKPVDKRADIWSFGVVLWEMLTGQRLFEAENVSRILADVLRAPIPFDALPSDTPPALRSLLDRCLDRNPRARLRDIGEARILLSSPGALEPPKKAGPIAARGRRTWIPWSIAAVALAGALAAWSPRASAPPPVTRATIMLPPGHQIRQPYLMAISPDGSHIAYTSPGQLFVRAIDSFDAVPIPGTEGAASPFFSPDGQWVGFFSSNRLMKVSLQGGTPVLLCPSVGGPNSASWGPDGKIVFAPRHGLGGLYEIPDAGGTPTVIAAPDSKKGENAYEWPDVLPDGKTVLFTVFNDSVSAPEQIVALERASGKHTVLVESGAYARYSASGHLIYMNGGTLMAAGFDAKHPRLSTTPVAILDGVRHTTIGAGWWAVSRTGSLIYSAGGVLQPMARLAWVDMSGAITSLPAPARNYGQFSLSPDGRQVATSLADGGRVDLWIYDIPRNTFTRLTFQGINQFPIWSPDGKRVTYSGRGSIMSKAADGSGPEEQLREDGTILAWSPDGLWFVYVLTRSGLWAAPASDPQHGRLLPQSVGSDSRVRFSPNGKWLAYWSDESGRGEVYVRDFPAPGAPAGGKWQISTGGGGEPIWDPSGKWLYYRTDNQMMRVAVTTEGGFTFSAPKALFDTPFGVPIIPIGNTALAPDGKRFLIHQPTHQQEPVTQLSLVQNWSAELTRKTAGVK